MAALSNHKKGDTWMGLSVTFSINGSPVDLTDATIIMRTRKRQCGGPVVDEWSTTDSTITITDAANGEFSVLSKIISWDVGVYYYEIIVTLSSGRVITIAEDTWEVTY